ncbi:MAG: sugar ABC transporter permease [Treponema sp.]|jgi:multiple sugar transport system permease protein|nr:sugar ABC transporter permease [Treponema sp.]
MTRLEKRNVRNGLLFCAPWILGFFGLQIYPIVYSFYLSLTDYSGFGKAVFIGIGNFREFLRDPMAAQAAYNTLYYTAFAVPVGVVVAIMLALAMNQKVREVAVYRAILYLPSILPAFAMVYIWLLFINPAYGLLTRLFTLLHLPQIDWIGDRHFTKPSVVILAQYGAGNAALIFLASLRSITRDLYESAEIDGAGVFRKFFTITVPMITPIILYDVIWGLSAGLQAFTQAYLMSSGGGRTGVVGPSNSLLFYVVYIYKTAFQYSRMGYAAAMALFLFLASVLIAIGVFKWGRSWVHYESD